jgi:filamentous hemagglutinin
VGDALEHDHIPSFASLRAAKEVELDRALTPAEKTSLYNNATAVELPKDVHMDGRTYAGKNTASQVQFDASDLYSASQRDIASLRNNLLNRGYGRSVVEQTMNSIVKRNATLGIKSP